MKRALWLPLVALLFFGCGSGQRPAPIKLVVCISIDQFPPSLLTRFEDLYSGGFKWLLDHSVWYTAAHHEHGYTVTAVGNFVLASGRYPGPVGMLGNDWYDRDLQRSVHCVEDTLGRVVGGPGEAFSFRRIETLTLGDWVKARFPRSRVISVAGKPRTAVLHGGQRADLALWYNRQGSFVTSDYYCDSIPAWLADFNQNLNIGSYRDSLWTRELEPAVYETRARRDAYSGEEDSYRSEPYSPVFPIGFDAALSPAEVHNDIARTPWFERMTLRLATAAVEGERLGQGGEPDLLFVGLSGTDWLGHECGPYSQEMMDQMLKVDRYLETFIDNLDRLVGRERILFVLSSDHGTLPLPEYLVEEFNLPAGRISREALRERYQAIGRALTEEFGASDLVVRQGRGFYYHQERLNELGVDPVRVTALIRKHLEGLEGVERVVSRDEILASDSTDLIHRRLRNMLHPQKSPEAWIMPRKYYTFKTPRGTSHGTPYEYDTHVPLLFARDRFLPQRIDRPVATVDIAPTVAKMLGVDKIGPVDGQVLEDVLP